MGGDLWESEGKGRVGPIGPFPHLKEQVGDVLVKQPPPRPGERAVIPNSTLLLLLLLLLLLVLSPLCRLSLPPLPSVGDVDSPERLRNMGLYLPCTLKCGGGGSK